MPFWKKSFWLIVSKKNIPLQPKKDGNVNKILHFTMDGDAFADTLKRNIECSKSKPSDKSFWPSPVWILNFMKRFNLKKFRTGYHVLKGGVIVSARTFFRNDLCSTRIIQHSRRIGSDSKYRWVHDLSLRSRRKKLDVLTKFYLLLFQTFWNLTVFKEKMDICYKRPPFRFREKSLKGGLL